MAVESISSSVSYQPVLQAAPVQKTVEPAARKPEAEHEEYKPKATVNADGAEKKELPDQHSEQLRKTLEQMTKKLHNAEVRFGYHEETHRVTIQILDKDSKEVIREVPAEKMLDTVAKIWEMAGILFDDRR